MPPQHARDTRRVLIIAKTYPELSNKYGETVCTAAVDDSGNPIRLYPIPFRYLSGPQRFKRYQWISASFGRSSHDLRPESHSIRSETITLGDVVPVTKDGWGKRADIVLKSGSWQYSSMERLLKDQREHRRSLAFVTPSSIVGVSVRKRDSEDATTFDQKLKELRSQNAAARNQLDLFEKTMPPKMKALEYIGERVCVEWKCSDSNCTGHSMQILDWEICELARKCGLDAAKAKVEELLDPNAYQSAFILGNFHMYPGSFAIIGLWYPPRNDRLF